jgi:hypothetical protein
LGIGCAVQPCGRNRIRAHVRRRPLVFRCR